MNFLDKEESFEKLARIVEKRIGSVDVGSKISELKRTVDMIAKDKGFPTAELCLSWLIAAPLSQEKMDMLAKYFTIGETYFMREQSAFVVLEEIVRQMKLAMPLKKIKIWCAGCASGEEAYSIAIAVQNIIKEMGDLRVEIMATDINPFALDKARKAEYTTWSFRGCSDQFKNYYFTEKEKGKYQLDQKIRQMVTFGYLNLAEDQYPSLLNGTSNIDIIFCRNVLMYFSKAHIKWILDGFSNCLTEEGVLFTGACENILTDDTDFETTCKPNLIFYRKGKNHTPIQEPQIIKSQNYEDYKPPVINTVKQKVPNYLEVAKTFFDQSKYEQSEIQLLKLKNRDKEAEMLLCESYANQGKLDLAFATIEKLVKTDRLNPDFYHLKAVILVEQNHLVLAKRALEKSLYLDNQRVISHFLLGNICVQLNNNKMARRAYHYALNILKSYADEEIVPDSGGTMSIHLKEMIENHLMTLT